jgi:uncharacterized protein (TIGR03435 family)
MQLAKDGEIPPLPEWMQNASADPDGAEGAVIVLAPSKSLGTMTGRRVTMQQLSATLERNLDTAVIDQTGLPGKYYFAFRYNTADDPDVAEPDLFGALKKLGLRLAKGKGPVETLVIDHLERVPLDQ